MSTARTEPGSFRDREGRVFYRDGEVFRALSERALGNWNALRGARFFEEAQRSGKIVATEEASLPGAELGPSAQDWVGALRHERIPFISYPYEWSFSMLRDAAALQLELLEAALRERFILKDASSYNLQWRGSQPVFIDVPSFEPLQPGETWVGYLQFCQLFLYPLLLAAYKDLPFHPFLRGSLDGISPESCDRILSSVRDRLRPGVFTHVYLQSRLQAMAADSRRSVRGELRSTKFSSEILLANVRRLRRLVGRLRWHRQSSEWSDYMESHSYTREDHEAKKRFVAEVSGSRRRALVWDLGCNTGAFSLIAEADADYVVALDSDHLAVERLYLELRRRESHKILPLVGNLADPSPSLGWRLRERKALAERGRPQLVLFLALIHHLVIGANVPMEEVLDWLASLGSELVIEFVTKDDPMVRKLLLNKEDRYADYEEDRFRRALSERFRIERSESLSSGTRVLYWALPESR